MSGTSGTLTIVITGGLGNLGSKLCRHLLDQNSLPSLSQDKYRVILVEHPDFIDRAREGKGSKPPSPSGSVSVLPCDLGNPTSEDEGNLREALGGAHALVHFSAVNPYPNATWSESAQSMDHAFYIFQLAVICKGES